MLSESQINEKVVANLLRAFGEDLLSEIVKSGNAPYGGKQLLKDQWMEEQLGVPTVLRRVR